MSNNEGVTPGDWEAFVVEVMGHEYVAIDQAGDTSQIENGGFNIAHFFGPDRKANSAHAIKCVNAHDSLVALAEAVAEGLELGNVASKIVPGPTVKTLHEMARDALAKIK